MRRALAVLLAGGLLMGCAPSAPAPSSSAATHSIVALGDSVPRGTNCDCTPYPELTADDLGGTATNDAVAGYTTNSVLRQLDGDNGVTEHVARAGIVEIEVGANDVANNNSCDTTLSCYADDVPQVETNLRTIVDRVHELAGAHALVVLLDYWSVWLGGSYAQAEGDQYVATAAELTDQINTAIKSVASATGSSYVDLRAAFKGPDYAYDETHYLSDDGDHPNAAGHQQIAAAAVAVIETAQRNPHP